MQKVMQLVIGKTPVVWIATGLEDELIVFGIRICRE